MFTWVVIAVAISVVVGYVRHERFMRRKRAAELAAGSASEHDEPR